MNSRQCPQPLLLLAGALCAGASLLLLSGCKGNTSAAAVVEKKISPPPSIQAYATPVDLRNADPLTSPHWSSAHWFPLVAPLNTDRTTAPAEGAVLYSDTTLYIAFISARYVSPFAQDMVSCYLDSSKFSNGSEMIHVAVNSTGQASCTWIRDAEPPTHPKEDGSPDTVHPISKIPADSMVPGLFTRVGQGAWNGAPAWTAVIAIPLNTLPLPLRSSPIPGTHWKINLLRTTLIGDPGSLQQLQANLSPVYVGQQAVSPYRLADLYLAPAQISSAR